MLLGYVFLKVDHINCYNPNLSRIIDPTLHVLQLSESIITVCVGFCSLQERTSNWNINLSTSKSALI